ncbi:MAG: MBL fold metallo-hydrolase [Acetobacteraceae bacterium]
MKVHHINVGAMQPYGGGLLDGRTPGFGPAAMTCHCLVLETEVGVVLVDTGTVSQDAAASAARLDPVFRVMDRVRSVAGEAAINQVRRLGHDPAAVKHIVMTHLDFDHAAGLIDFPNAKVHLAAAEAEAAHHPSSRRQRGRYRPAQWGGTAGWQTYETFAADWFDLPAAYVDAVPGVMLVPLPGHTPGHCGVAVDQGRGWLLHAGDAILNMREIDPEHPSTPSGARVLQWAMETSQVQRRRSLAHLRRIRRDFGDHVRFICTHDPACFDLSRLAAGAVGPTTAPRAGG